MSGGCPKCAGEKLLQFLQSSSYGSTGALWEIAIDVAREVVEEKVKWCPEHAPSVTGECALPYEPTEIDVDDIVQAAPSSGDTAPVLAIVVTVHSWGVDALTSNGRLPVTRMVLKWGDFSRIGRATWGAT